MTLRRFVERYFASKPPAVPGDGAQHQAPGGGETYIRNEQYRDQRFRVLEKTDYWAGVSIKRPDRTMVGTIRMDKGGQWAQYIEKLFRGRKLEATIVSVCRPITRVGHND
jgi:hypothetical protein